MCFDFVFRKTFFSNNIFGKKVFRTIFLEKRFQKLFFEKNFFAKYFSNDMFPGEGERFAKHNSWNSFRKKFFKKRFPFCFVKYVSKNSLRNVFSNYHSSVMFFETYFSKTFVFENKISNNMFRFLFLVSKKCFRIIFQFLFREYFSKRVFRKITYLSMFRNTTFSKTYFSNNTFAKRIFRKNSFEQYSLNNILEKQINFRKT